MNLTRILEAVLFAADAPLPLTQVALSVPDTPIEEVQAALEDLQARYEAEERGFALSEVAGGWQLLTHPNLYAYVERFLEGKRRTRLSRPALESLAVIAYRQPMTRGELEDLRGVDCGGVLHTLIERDLVTIGGRSQAIGRPLLYKTTERFLEHFGLVSLGDLPRLEEVESLLASEDVRSQIETELSRRLPDSLQDAEQTEEDLPAQGENGDDEARKASPLTIHAADLLAAADSLATAEVEADRGDRAHGKNGKSGGNGRNGAEGKRNGNGAKVKMRGEGGVRAAARKNGGNGAVSILASVVVEAPAFESASQESSEDATGIDGSGEPLEG